MMSNNNSMTSREQTCAIIKPDAVASGYTGQIISLIEASGFTIRSMEKRHLSKKEAEAFYEMHSARSFFAELVAFMTSGPVIVLLLEREQGIALWRELMGTTDPAQARLGSIRKLFGRSIGENATHGSDTPESAAREVAFFFDQTSRRS